MCRQYIVQIYAIGSGECHWTQKVNLEELITSPNPSFPRNMWKLKEPLVCMWPSEGFRDTTQKMTRSQIEGDSVGFGGIACLSKGCRRFEDNADTDTWNTSKALRRRCVIRAPDHQDLVEGSESLKLCSGKMSVRVSGGLFEASCIESGIRVLFSSWVWNLISLLL